MKHDRTFFAATGIPSLFLIFSVLCLAVLSLLTLGKSRDELQASNFAVQQTDLYTRHAKKPQELSQQFKSSLLLITVRFLIQMPTFHLPARFLMKLTVSHTILLRMLFHSRKRYLIHRSYL